MKLLISLLMIALIIGCGTTSAGRKSRTLDTSNLTKGSDGIYRITERPLHSKRNKTPITEKPTHGSEESSIKVNWSDLILFYLIAGWLIFMALITYKTFKNYKAGFSNPFKEKKKGPSDLDSDEQT